MANIIRTGKTPFWGTWKGKTTMSGMSSAVILDSFNSSVEIKDYEQTDENGAVCGYLIYDQTVSFDASGTLLANQCYANEFRVGSATQMNCSDRLTIIPFMSYNHANNDAYSMGINESINEPNIAIVKSISFNTSAGGAATFSLSGTAYSFGQNTLC